MRERRQSYEKDPAEVMRICHEGSLKARETAQKTLQNVRKAMAMIEL